MPTSKLPTQNRRNPQRSQSTRRPSNQSESQGTATTEDESDSDIYKADSPHDDTEAAPSSQHRTHTPPSPTPTSHRKRKRRKNCNHDPTAEAASPSSSPTLTNHLEQEEIPTLDNYHEVGQKLGHARMTLLLAQQPKVATRPPSSHLLEATALQETYLLDKMALALASNVSLQTLEAAV